MLAPGPLRLAALHGFRVEEGELKDAVLRVQAADVHIDIALAAAPDSAPEMEENVFQA